jgi:hypothetical protein
LGRQGLCYSSRRCHYYSFSSCRWVPPRSLGYVELHWFVRLLLE